jgi:GNAT superfamily N-acetyltransferase
VDATAALAVFDAQLRRDPRDSDTTVERDEHVIRVVSSTPRGWNGVVWTDLAGLDPDLVDMVIERQLARFASTTVHWEWKYYTYDQPPDLADRLQAAGLVPHPDEAVMIADVAELDLDVPAPPGVALLPVVDPAGVDAVIQVHDEVFGGDSGGIGDRLQAALDQPRPAVEAVVAVAGDRPIAAGRVEFYGGTDFAGLWGGGTVADFRHRGVFRALVAYRARRAKERGARYLQVDASDDSRPILSRLGFVQVATSVPFTLPDEP